MQDLITRNLWLKKRITQISEKNIRSGKSECHNAAIFLVQKTKFAQQLTAKSEEVSDL